MKTTMKIIKTTMNIMLVNALSFIETERHSSTEPPFKVLLHADLLGTKLLL